MPRRSSSTSPPRTGSDGNAQHGWETMNGKRVGAVLPSAFLLSSASSFAVEPTHLARRGADDGEEGRHERNRGGRGGVETAPARTLADPGAQARVQGQR